MAIVDGKIKCSVCQKLKETAEFSPSRVSRGSGTCRLCLGVAKKLYQRNNREKSNDARKKHRNANLEKSRETQRKYYAANKPAFRRWNLKRYKITPEQYAELLAQQDGGCAICESTQNLSGKRLFVDHDHVTGEVRGILCNRCNAGIGALGDTFEGVKNALQYLRRARNVDQIPDSLYTPEQEISGYGTETRRNN